jgi:hypothetical protein
VSFNWVKGHSENYGNDSADLLAKHGCTLSYNDIQYDLVPFSYVKKFLRTETINKWDNQWISTMKGNITKKFFTTIKSRLDLNFEPNFKTTQFFSGQQISNHIYIASK